MKTPTRSNKTTLLAFAISFFCLPIALSSETPNTSDWIPLFNGKDLDGWSVQCQEADKDEMYWTVQDHVIVCNTKGDKDHDYMWLQYDTEYSDFELKLKFKGFRESTGNTGIQIRSRYDTVSEEANGGWLDGPQVDINPKMPFRNGLIYDETRTEKRWIAPSLESWVISKEQGPSEYEFRYADEGDGWNDMHIICKGTHITTIVNGIVIKEYDGSGVLDNEAHQKLNVGMSGYICIQLHRKNDLKAHYKDLYLKEL